MSLQVLDGNGVAQQLKTTVDGADLVPHNKIDSVAGTVAATQSGAWNVAITGTLPSIIPGVGATNLGKAEDAAHTTGDTGVMVLAVRNDGGAVLAGTTGDYVPLTTDANGALRVVGGGGGSQYAEDAAHVSTDLGTIAMAVRRDTPSTMVSADNDYSALTVDNTGRLYTNTLLATGTNSIGRLGTANSGVVIGAVEQSADWDVFEDVESVFVAGVKLTVKTAFVALAAFPGTVVAAVVGKKIRVLSASISHTAAGSTSLTDGSGGTVRITVNHVATGSVQVHPARGHIMETTSGTGLFATATAGTANIWVQYVEV